MAASRSKQFSILFLLGVTLLVALAVRFWPYSGESTRIRNWSSHYWFDHSVGIVKRVGEENVWTDRTIVSGTGCLCVLNAGSHIENSTGGSYYKVWLQLPKRVRPGDKFTVVPFNKDSPIEKNEIREMTAGTMVAMKFGNPFGQELAGDSKDSQAIIEVLAIDDEAVTIKTEIDLVLRSADSLKINETIRLTRGQPASPLEAIPTVDTASSQD